MKVFDAITLFNELDLLELRLNILDPYVDHFIIVESKQTFMGQPKPLYYEENKERFAKWNHKIVHIVVPDIEIKKEPFERHWVAYALEEGFVREVGDPEDIAFFSDLDEIWNPEVLSKADDQIHSLYQLNYTYYLNMRSNEEWTGTLMTKVKSMRWNFNKQHRTEKPNLLVNGGWHFTNMGGKEQIMKKIRAYDHGHELNPVWIEEHLDENIDKGGDYLGRWKNYKGEDWRFWLEEDHWPQYLKDHRQDYISLLK